MPKKNARKGRRAAPTQKSRARSKSKPRKPSKSRTQPKPLRIVDARPKEPRDGVGGRPTTYVAEYAHIAQVMCEGGATDVELARAFGVHVSTIYAWAVRHSEFREAVKAGKVALDDRVEASLYHRAIGYSHPTTKIMQNGSEVIAVEHTEHYPPDTAAAFIWLKNRRADKWRDKQEVAHELVDKPLEELTEDEIDARLKAIAERRAAAAKADQVGKSPPQK